MPFDPEKWLESMIRELKTYVGAGINNSVLNPSQVPVGLYNPTTNPNGPYELVMEFPTPESMRTKVPLPRTMVHLEIDAIDNNLLGFGDGIFRTNYDSGSQTASPQAAGSHHVNFDVGIWSSDKSGGTTARLRMYQLLNTLFHGKLAQLAFDAQADGGDGRIEILNFSGGRFITETINDVVTYRTVEGVLELRVFSRTPMAHTVDVPTIEEILQEPSLVIVE